MEISYHDMKLHRDFSHSGLSHSELHNLEWFVEIMCAMANVPVVCPFGQLPHPGIAPSTNTHHLRLDFFAELYSKHRQLVPLIDFSLCAAKVATQPLESLRALWDLLMENVPSDVNIIKTVLKARTQRILHKVSGDVYCSAQLSYAKAVWTHDYPDRRAYALVHAHYVLLVQLCSKAVHTGRSELFVQAVVHPSERNTLMHYARISMWQTLRNEPFSLLSSRCSCEDGYVSMFFVNSAPIDVDCSADGLCSHVQALLLTLLDVKMKRTPMVRTPLHAL